MSNKEIITWLLEGDVALQYQVHRDLLAEDRQDLQQRIASEGWGAQFLSKRKVDGHWGDRFYQPKWISTHYTLLDLRNLYLPQDNELVRETIELVLQKGKADDGGIPLGPSTAQHSDLCVNAMFLNYAAYFKTPEKKLHSIVDNILNETMPDGGFNCRSNGSGARHSSLHTTLSVLEGLAEYRQNGYLYRLQDSLETEATAREFILMHKLYLSDRTGEIISPNFLKLAYPGRWYYDILRALDYFARSGADWDSRMEPALQVLLNKRNQSGTWNLQSKHPGQQHFEMERGGRPSRWNTLRALRVLNRFGQAALPG